MRVCSSAVPTFAVAVPAFAVVAMLASAARVDAELVFFTSGRTLSVKNHRVEGDSLTLELRTGGEITCDHALIARIAPDEVPYPEPAPPTAATIEQLPAALDAVPFGDLIDREAKAQGVSPKLVRALIQVESGYQPRARSPKGAMGLMQLMPTTARQYAVANPYDVKANLRGGIRHLKSLLDRFPLAMALAAYNAGEAAVQRFRGIPPYQETRDYVARILQLAGR